MRVPRFPYGEGREGNLMEENSRKVCWEGLLLLIDGNQVENLGPVREVHLKES